MGFFCCLVVCVITKQLTASRLSLVTKRSSELMRFYIRLNSGSLCTCHLCLSSVAALLSFLWRLQLLAQHRADPPWCTPRPPLETHAWKQNYCSSEIKRRKKGICTNCQLSACTTWVSIDRSCPCLLCLAAVGSRIIFQGRGGKLGKLRRLSLSHSCVSCSQRSVGSCCSVCAVPGHAAHG